MAEKIKGITIEIGGDTTKLGKAISDSESKSKALTGELREVNKMLKFDPTNVELITQKQQILTEQIEATSDKLKILKEAQEQIEAQFKSGEIGAEQYRAFQRELTSTEGRLNALKNTLQATTNEIEQSASETAQAASKFDELSETIGQQEQKLSELRAEYTRVVVEQGKNSREAQELANEMKSLNSDLSKNKAEMEKAESASKELSKALDDVSDKAEESGDGFTVMKGAIADLISDGIQNLTGLLKDFATEADTSYSTFQAQTGASAQEMKELKKEIDELYMNNFGESLQDIGDKMAYVKQVTGEVDPTKIKELTENAITLEDTFGSDFSETIRGVNNLMYHFGIDSKTAFDLFAQGSQLGLDYTGELGDNISEYGGNFQQAGYSAEEYFQLLVNGSQNGAYNLDKVNDSINEVKNRLGDGTIERNLDMFSSGTQNVYREWENGKATMKDVIDSIVADIQTADSEQQALTMSAAAFGTMGEDANLKVVSSLTSTGEAFTDVKGKMESVKDIKYDNVTSQLSEIGRTIKMDIVTPLAEKLLPKVKEILEYVSNNLPTILPILAAIGTAMGTIFAVNKISTFITSIKTIGVAFQSLSGVTGILSTIKGAFSGLFTFLAANPVVLIIGAIIGAIVLLWTKCEWFRDGVTAIWNTIVEFLRGAVATIVNFFTVTLPEGLNSLITWFQNLPTAISEWLTAAWNHIKAWGANLWTSAVEIGTNFVNSIVTFFQELPYKIGAFLGTALSNIIQWGINLWNFATTQIPAFINQVITFFAQLPSRIWEWLKYAFDYVVKWGSDLIAKGGEAASNFINRVITYIKELPGKIQAKLTETINKVKTWASDMAAKGKEAAKSLLDNTVNGLTELPNKIKDIGKNVVHGLWNGIIGAKDWIIKKVKNFASDIIKGFKDTFQIHSPSRIMRDEIGKYLAQGVGVGIEENADEPLNAVEKLKEDMINSASGINGLTIGRQIEHTFKTPNEKAPVSALIPELVSMVAYYFPKLIEASQKAILLDGKELVGQTIDEIDNQLAVRYQMKARGI